MYDEWEAKRQAEQALTSPIPINPVPVTKRQRLEYRRSMVSAELTAIDKAIKALDDHPELEEFIETLAKAGA